MTFFEATPGLDCMKYVRLVRLEVIKVIIYTIHFCLVTTTGWLAEKTKGNSVCWFINLNNKSDSLQRKFSFLFSNFLVQSK